MAVLRGNGDLPAGSQVLSIRTIVVAAVVLVVVAAGATTMLLWLLGGGSPSDTARLDAIRTAASIVVGTGGAAALLLAARRQRSTELDLVQKEHDATERRVTELYGNAVDKLGSDKAPVRLAGLYALERLAQANPEHRQTIVNVVCAYLRMSFLPPRNSHVAFQYGDLPRPHVPGGTASTLLVVTRYGSHAPPAELAPVGQTEPEEGEAQQELQVRLAAQRILTGHLRPYGFFGYAEPVWKIDAEPVAQFWDGVYLDLVGAYLVNFDFTQCQVVGADFSNTVFDGPTSFNGAAFIDTVLFHGAAFRHGAWFKGATFASGVGLGAKFHGSAHFENAEFGEESGLGMEVSHKAWFNEAKFVDARFDFGSFGDDVSFSHVTFDGVASFEHVDFRGDVTFSGVTVCDPEAPHQWPAGWNLEVDQDGVGRLRHQHR